MDADFRYDLEADKVIFTRHISQIEYNECLDLANKYELNNEQCQKLRDVLLKISPQPRSGSEIEKFIISDNFTVTLICKPLQKHEYMLNDKKFSYGTFPGIHRVLRGIYSKLDSTNI